MNTLQFEAILENRLNSIKGVLGTKAAEYAVNDDRLHNFNRAASIANTTRETALMGMFMKHLVSVLDMVDKMEAGTTPSEYLVNEKIGDSINYLILLEACFMERINIAKDAIQYINKLV